MSELGEVNLFADEGKELNLRRLAVATQRWILSLLPMAIVAVLAGCGSSTFNVQNPPPPPPSNISIAFQPVPSGTVTVGSATNLTAVVSNDSLPMLELTGP